VIIFNQPNIGTILVLIRKVWLKREAGENPARSRRCNGEIFCKIHWDTWEGAEFL